MTHVCNAMKWPLVEASVKAFLAPKQRREFILHNGSNATVLENLARHMLTKQCLPTDLDLGGSLEVSADAFVKERDFELKRLVQMKIRLRLPHQQLSKIQTAPEKLQLVLKMISRLVGTCHQWNKLTQD